MTPWRALGTGIWVGEYVFRGNPIHTLVVDLGEGRLAVVSPGTGVDDAAFVALDALGTVVALVSPGAFHHMGLPLWHARYPQARLFGTHSGIAHIAKQHPQLPALEPIEKLQQLAGNWLAIYETPGKHGDLLAFITHGDDVTLFSCEYLINWVDLPSSLLFRLAFKWTNSAPGLRLAKPSGWFLGAKLPEVARFCLDKIDVHGVSRLVPCHGALVEGPDTRQHIEDAIRARL